MTRLLLFADEINHFDGDQLVEYPFAMRSASSDSHKRVGAWNLDDGSSCGLRVRYSFDDQFLVDVTPFCKFCFEEAEEEELIEAPEPNTVVLRWHHLSCAYTELGRKDDRWWNPRHPHLEASNA